MSESFFQSFKLPTNEMFAPIAKLQRLMLESIERAAEVQVELVKSYAELGAKQFRDLSEVRDLEGLKSFASTQAEFASTVGRKLMEDFQQLGTLSSEFREEAARIIRESAETAPTFEPVEEPVAKPAAKASAKSTADKSQA